MHLLATEDISGELIQTLCAELQDKFAVEVEDGRYFFKSFDAPSWIRLVAESEWWVQALAGAGALYVAELIKEAAKDTWKSRSKAISAIAKAGTTIKVLAKSISSFKSQSSPSTQVVVALPEEPHQYFGAQLQLSGTDSETLELELALFVHFVPAISAMIATNKASGQNAATGYFIELLPNGDVHLWWFDQETLKKRESIISLVGGAV